MSNQSGKMTTLIEYLKSETSSGKDAVVLCPSEKRAQELERMYGPIKGVTFMYWKTYVDEIEASKKPKH